MASVKVGPPVWFAGTCFTLLAGCAAPRTQLAPIPKGAIKAEQEKQKEVEVGRLRAVTGAGFDRVSALEYYLERLRQAYRESTYLQSESAAPVIELYRNGRPFAEYSRAGLSEIKAP